MSERESSALDGQTEGPPPLPPPTYSVGSGDLREPSQDDAAGEWDMHALDAEFEECPHDE